MIIAGKCPPEKEELEEAEKRGFENVELYLEKQHLEDLEKTISTLEKATLEVVSVHTPHVSVDEDKYIEKADELADRFDAFLVFHTSKYHHTAIADVEEIFEFSSDYGYENNPGASVRYLKSMILDPGHNFVLDTAHLYMAETDHLGKIEYLLDNYTGQVELIHLCDSTREKDGLGFGKGEMNMEEVSKTIKNSGFDGILVLEVMPEKQEKALEKFSRF